MPDTIAPPGSRAEADALAAENIRLRKIVDALIKRAEQSAKAESSDFKLFETAVVLESEV